jgi:dTDP-4-amino-4,6-dideoxygalactose transaminase
MQAIGLSQDDEVLLPSYIGWSSREGSGVFDPIEELGVQYSFYQISQRLQVDVDDVKAKIQARRPRLLVLIHYFGFPDSNADALCRFARDNNVLVLEDEAHAMLSDQVGGICGRSGDAAIYSMHKLLPFARGGRLVLNRKSHEEGMEMMGRPMGDDPEQSFQDYDLYRIALRRRENACFLLQLLGDSYPCLEPLYSSLPDGVVPQSLPVLINKGSRDDLYFQMNAVGYGVVSLYHTLIDQIRSDEFPEAHYLSRHIMNLPVHQDTDKQDLANLMECLTRLVKC